MLARATAAIAPALVWLAMTAPPAAATTAVVRSGPLTAIVGAERWALAFEQAHGGPTLREVAGGGGAAPGRLGFRTAKGWRQATRVLSRRTEGRALVLRLATNDPAGRRLSVLLRPSGTGIVTFRAEVAGRRAGVRAVGIAFGAPRGERHLGLGERSDAVDQRGRTVENYVSDGPWPEATRPVARGTLPPQGFRPRDDATYFPVPWLLSSRGFGVLVDRDETSTFRLGAADGRAWSVEVAAPALALRVFAGPTPAAALARFTKAGGRQPAPSAPWAFGPWLQTGQPNAPPLADQVSDLEKLRAADAPVLSEGAHSRSLYLPRGRWLDGRTALKYDGAGDGGLHVGTGPSLRGGRTVHARAELDELPLYVRAGAVLPLLPADVSTLSEYGAGAVVRLRDRLDRLRLLAFPAGRSSAGMFERERVVSRPARGAWRLEIRGERTRTYELEASTAGLRGTAGRAFVPCGLRLAGRELPRSAWTFDARARLLRATFRARQSSSPSRTFSWARISPMGWVVLWTLA